VAETTLGRAHPIYAQRLNNLGEALRAQGRYDEAEVLYRAAIAVDDVTVGRNHPSHSTHLNNLAETLIGKGDAAGAEALLRAAGRHGCRGRHAARRAIKPAFTRSSGGHREIGATATARAVTGLDDHGRRPGAAEHAARSGGLSSAAELPPGRCRSGPGAPPVS